MIRDQTIYFQIITPGGLIIRLDQEHAPKELWDHFRAVEDTEAMVSERVVAYLSRLTGCRCTLRREIQVTCEANTPPPGRN